MTQREGGTKVLEFWKFAGGRLRDELEERLGRKLGNFQWIERKTVVFSWRFLFAS